MLNIKKEADVLEVGDITVATCPICRSYVSHIYYMQDAHSKKRSKWFSCHCGVVFNAKRPEYTPKKQEKFDKKSRDSWAYPIRLYAPIIEELIYGRRVLLIDLPNSYQEDAFKERGWVPTVISNFESHQFLESQKFNLIWFYGSFERLSDPIASLELTKTLLAEDGILFLGTPDTDFINTRSSSCFIHWKHDENHIMWNRRSLTRHLDSLGFQTILSRQNYEHRFPIWDDLHLIAQKKFF